MACLHEVGATLGLAERLSEDPAALVIDLARARPTERGPIVESRVKEIDGLVLVADPKSIARRDDEIAPDRRL
jgi:hypothetical protein